MSPFIYCCDECHHAECHCVECRHAECRGVRYKLTVSTTLQDEMLLQLLKFKAIPFNFG